MKKHEKNFFLYKTYIKNLGRIQSGIEFDDSQKKSGTKILKICAKM